MVIPGGTVVGVRSRGVAVGVWLADEVSSGVVVSSASGVSVGYRPS